MSKIQTGYQIRIAKRNFKWYGFNIKVGFVFGTYKGVDYVSAGYMSKNAKKVKVWYHPHKEQWKLDQTIRPSDWRVEYMEAKCGLGAKICAKIAEARKLGFITPENTTTAPTNNKHWFCCDRANRHGHRLEPWEEAELPKTWTWAEADKASPVRG